MNQHLTSARSCSWYAEERLRDLGGNDVEDGEAANLQVDEDVEEQGLLERDFGDNDMGDGDAPDLQVDEDVEGEGSLEYDPQEDPDVAMEFGPYGDELQFLPEEHVEILDEKEPHIPENNIYLETTHSRSTVLDDEDDERITIVDEDAGRVLCKETPSMYTQDSEGDASMEGEGEPNPFASFSSELDWRVAHWAVKDGPGHNAFNRLLETPGVSNLAEFS